MSTHDGVNTKNNIIHLTFNHGFSIINIRLWSELNKIIHDGLYLNKTYLCKSKVFKCKEEP